MCGRYRLSRRKQILEEHFDSVSGDQDWSPRYNTALTQPVPVIRQDPRQPVRELSLLRWGLMQSWAKDMSMAVSMMFVGFVCQPSELSGCTSAYSNSDKKGKRVAVSFGYQCDAQTLTYACFAHTV
jgi:hypothetical protein